MYMFPSLWHRKDLRNMQICKIILSHFNYSTTSVIEAYNLSVLVKGLKSTKSENKYSKEIYRTNWVTGAKDRTL